MLILEIFELEGLAPQGKNVGTKDTGLRRTRSWVAGEIDNVQLNLKFRSTMSNFLE